MTQLVLLLLLPVGCACAAADAGGASGVATGRAASVTLLILLLMLLVVPGMRTTCLVNGMRHVLDFFVMCLVTGIVDNMIVKGRVMDNVLDQMRIRIILVNSLVVCLVTGIFCIFCLF